GPQHQPGGLVVSDRAQRDHRPLSRARTARAAAAHDRTRTDGDRGSVANGRGAPSIPRPPRARCAPPREAARLDRITPLGTDLRRGRSAHELQRGRCEDALPPRVEGVARLGSEGGRVNEDEDLELQALQRQLDDAFQTTRRRAAFEDELWLRMQARRPIWTRFREGLAGLVGSLREAPAIPSAAVAIALIVVIGAGIISLGGGLHLGGGGGAASTSFDNGGKNGSAAPPAYGALPMPAMQPGSVQAVSPAAGRF